VTWKAPADPNGSQPHRRREIFKIESEDAPCANMMKYDEHCGTSYGVDGELMTVVDIMAQSATGQRVPRQNWSSCTAPLILDGPPRRV